MLNSKITLIADKRNQNYVRNLLICAKKGQMFQYQIPQ